MKPLPLNLALIYASLSAAVVSSLGMLLVPSIAVEMRVPVSTAQWMLTINLLVGAISTPILGRLSDGRFKKSLLIWSLTAVVAGSIVAALAPNFTVFLVGRALQGLSYGIVPITITIARQHLPPQAVKHGISSLAVTTATGAGIGYPLTGVLAGAWGFRAAFGFAVLYAASALVVVVLSVPSQHHAHFPRPSFDFCGAILFGVGLGAFLLAVSEGQTWGWTSMATITVFLLAALFLSAWALVELRARSPMINLRVLRQRDIVLANLTAVGLGGSMYIVLSIVSLISQAPQTTGYGLAMPIHWAGFVMLPFSIGSFAANRVVRVIGPRLKTSMALLPGAAALVMLSAVGLAFFHDDLWALVLGMFVNGVGLGATYAALPGLIERRVATLEFGSAVSFNQVLRTVGGSVGSAMSAAAIAATLAASAFPSQAGIVLSLVMSAIVSAIIASILAVHHMHSRGRPYY